MKKEHIIVYLLSAIIGCFFIFSAITKLMPIESFEYTFRSQLNFSSFAAAYWARFFVGLEAGLGFLLLINMFGRSKWVVKMSFLLVVAFTLHLVLLYFRVGNDVNCGCMGDRFYMSPLNSILKNLALLVVLGIVWRKADTNHSNTLHWTASLMLAAFVATPFIVFPKQTKFLDLSAAYEGQASPLPPVDLRQGKQFVALLSLTCEHCIHAATSLTQIKKQMPELPIYVFFGKIPDDSIRMQRLAEFKEASKFDGIPFSFLKNETFIKLSGGYVPALYWIEDGKIVRKPDAGDVTVKELELWLKNDKK